jgi:hypothetical protein
MFIYENKFSIPFEMLEFEVITFARSFKTSAIKRYEQDKLAL